MTWRNLDNWRPDSAHYSIMAIQRVDTEMKALREMFPEAKADDLNFVLFSTSGVHGSYCTIEDCESTWNHPDPDARRSDVTFVIVHPRLVAMRYGNCKPSTADDFDFLKQLRQSSWEAVQKIGAPS